MRITAENVHSLFRYDDETGLLYWLHRPAAGPAWNGQYAGRRAGTKTKKGCWQINYQSHCYLAHRIIWLMLHGSWPPSLIDHKDLNSSNNRIDNLRLATSHQNMCNRGVSRISKSGLKGVSRHSKNDCWVAFIGDNNQTLYLGSFPTKESAHSAYREAAVKLHGEFARVS